jgi:hypothetical protein
MSLYDPCVFIYDDKDIILLLYMNDMIIFGKDIQTILKFKE